MKKNDIVIFFLCFVKDPLYLGISMAVAPLVRVGDARTMPLDD
jgi:hypothetical protein